MTLLKSRAPAPEAAGNRRGYSEAATSLSRNSKVSEKPDFRKGSPLGDWSAEDRRLAYESMATCSRSMGELLQRRGTSS